MMRVRLLLLLLLLCLATPVRAAPELHLSAWTVRSEFLAGERFTIAARLFNDGDQAIVASVLIEDDGTFARLPPRYDKPPAIFPKSSTPFHFHYQVLETTPKGLHTFTVHVWPTGETKTITIRVQPVVAPPAAWHGYNLFFPVLRA